MVAIEEPGKPMDYRSDSAYKAAVRRYKTFKHAQRVWRQISPGERRWILKQFRYKDPQAAVLRDRNADLQELRLTQRQLRSIRDYPRSEHRRTLYKKQLAASPPRKDVFVARHDKRLREISRKPLNRRESEKNWWYVRGIDKRGGAHGKSVRADDREEARRKFMVSHPRQEIVLVHPLG